MCSHAVAQKQTWFRNLKTWQLQWWINKGLSQILWFVKECPWCWLTESLPVKKPESRGSESKSYQNWTSSFNYRNKRNFSQSMKVTIKIDSDNKHHPVKFLILETLLGAPVQIINAILTLVCFLIQSDSFQLTGLTKHMVQQQSQNWILSGHQVWAFEVETVILVLLYSYKVEYIQVLTGQTSARSKHCCSATMNTDKLDPNEGGKQQLSAQHSISTADTEEANWAQSTSLMPAILLTLRYQE